MFLEAFCSLPYKTHDHSSTAVKMIIHVMQGYIPISPIFLHVGWDAVGLDFFSTTTISADKRLFL